MYNRVICFSLKDVKLPSLNKTSQRHNVPASWHWLTERLITNMNNIYRYKILNLNPRLTGVKFKVKRIGVEHQNNKFCWCFDSIKCGTHSIETIGHSSKSFDPFSSYFPPRNTVDTTTINLKWRKQNESNVL